MISLFLSLIFVGAHSSVPAPNVVFIVADDLGWNEMGFQNRTRGLLTPNIDALASAGVILKNYYTNPLCSPSRSALMSGMYNHRIGTQASVINWDTPWAPSPNISFLPQRFKKMGYRTAMFGKWHLGMYTQKFYPTSRGFDEYQGYLQGCGSYGTHVSSCCDAPSDPLNFSSFMCPKPSGKDYRGFDWFSGTSPNISTNGTSSSHLIASFAEDFIQRSTKDPFFLYLPFQNIHQPYDCSPASFDLFANASLPKEQKVIFAYIYELDQAVGRVASALRATGAMNNTILVFVSDNGAPPAPNVLFRNAPLRGWKAQVWEGGTRVPAFVHAPGRLRGGVQSHSMVHVTDWTPTLVAAAGGTVEAGLDGLNVWGTLSHDAPVRGEVPVNINPLCNDGQFRAPKAALRVGDMKLVCWCYSIAGIAGGSTTGCQPDPAHPQAWPQVFNVTADPSETTNVAPQHPHIQAALEARLAEIASASVEPMQWTPPYQGPGYACASCPLHPGASDPWQPWEAWL